MKDFYLDNLKSKFSSELLQLWQYYQPKFAEMIYMKFQGDYNNKWKEQTEKQEAAINIQNEIIRMLEKRVEELEKKNDSSKP